MTGVTVVVDVDAPPATLWTILTQPSTWPAWTESMDTVDLLDGDLRLGARARIVQPGLRPMVWTVTAFEPGRAFTWTAEAAGVRTAGTHEVEALDGGARSRLTLGLTQRGALAPLIRLLLGRRSRRYVGLEAAGLKAAAEDRARTSV
ncbi:SRPBCC family protein [Actinophytocola gossypii]|uniref:SRPBCC family protein n=1 Tax=Actinophytocola gossypii TaxID=2812003 RepID=A0ABT2JCQ1_9PSEU|nr:SRPBCC family protein [Actinophytocola gossypii]MCT2585556.1 SRPBCC family protein [Actinophytocola gossypii]